MITTEETKVDTPESVAGTTNPGHPVVNATKPRRKVRLLIICGLVLLLCAGLASWLASRGPQPMTYTVATASRGPVTKVVNSTGTVNPVLTIMVGTYVSGVIDNLSCDYNTQVKKGQLCAKIDPRPYQTVVDQDRANVSTAKAQLEKDKASLAYAKLTFDRDTSLLKDGVVSQDTFDNAKSAYGQLQAQIGVDEATIAEHEAELNTAEVNLGYTNITSPVDGTVVSRNVTMGQTVAASFQTPTLFLIATDLTKMQVDTNVSESDMGNLCEGDKASFTVEAFPNRIFEGKVVQVRQSPQTVQNVVTYDTVVAVDNHDLALKPGMTATTKIITDERLDVLRVPDQAFRYIPGDLSGAALQPSSPSASFPAGSSSKESSIWVLRNGNPHRVPVKYGLDDDSYTEIVSGGVQAGDQVITSEQSSGRRYKSGAAPTIPKF